MRSQFFAKLRGVFGAAAILATLPGAILSQPSHGISMYGDPGLPPDFVSFPYANADAPKGGRLVLAEGGGFDSLHPFIRKGRAPWHQRGLVFDTLMARNWDEPFALYGLLAESINVGANRDWVEFTLRPEARFSDGSPVTVADVMWSYETLGTKGHPRYQTAWGKVASMEQTGPRSVKFTFNVEDRELALLMGMRPILQKSQWEGRDFSVSGFDLIPIGSGPYTVGDYEAGRYIEFKRNPDYWAADLPARRGQFNFDTVRVDYYADATVIFEAFRAGESSVFREGNPARWASNYDFPRVASGDVVMNEIPHQRPTGIRGLVMNTRRPVFSDIRVRDAMMHLFNFTFINRTVTGGGEPRIRSFFDNSSLGMKVGEPAEGAVRALLEPFADQIPAAALDGYALPEGDDSLRNRRALRRALALFEQAGWTLQEGKLRNADGAPFRFEILLVTGANETRQIVDLFVEALETAGVEVAVTPVDNAQYKERTQGFDFDMTWYRRSLSLSPGNEQKLYWGSAMRETPGSRNWMGVASPAIDAMIDEMLRAEDQDGFTAATRALDRLLTAGRYVIPVWYTDHSRLAHVKEIRFPERLPVYGDWIGFLPDVWWYEE
ncbi:extracellular solute-binding protein [Aliiroseovarius sp.]|uniref:extracellular solute-binding protein n=1 Tax=Aliiroseovarius sp. TaxID=1872442 RepID=UPI002609D899|nr:extracellular solute-binding protein [Aliiroseovarius sp.]